MVGFSVTFRREVENHFLFQGVIMQSFSVRFLLCAIAVWLTGCATTPQEPRVDASGPSVQETVTYEGPKARIAVANFKCQAAQCSGDIGEGVSDMLTTALFRSNRFIVLERGEGLDELKEELDLMDTGYIEEGKGAEKGLMEGADILLMGAITEFEPKASGVGGGIGGLHLGSGILGGVLGGKEEAYIKADLRLVDVRRSRVINAATVEGQATSWKVGGLGGALVGDVALGGALGGYKNTPMEKAVRDMLDAAVETISQRVPQEYYRYPGQGKAQPAGYQQPTAAVQSQSSPDLLDPSSREDARKIQSRLAELGFYTSTIDGIWGKGSRGALTAFKKSKGLPATGDWDMTVQQMLMGQ